MNFYFASTRALLHAIILFFAICEGSKIPIELRTEAPVDAAKLTSKTSNPTQFTSVHPRYLVYNILQVGPNRPIPLIHFPYGKPGSAYVESSFNYYGTPLYDYQIHYSPFFPTVPAMIPTYVPQQQPITPSPPASSPTSTTDRPFNHDDDNIEKLDEKLDPSLEMNLNNEKFMHDDDSVVIEAVDK